MNKKHILLGFAAILSGGLMSHGATVLMNVARTAGFIEHTPNYNGTFPVQKVIDGSVAEAQTDPASYWITPNGTSPIYFIMDLRGEYPIESISLYNTHNRQHNDRGTGPFKVSVATAVEPKPPSVAVNHYFSFNNDLIDRSPISAVTGTMYDAFLAPMEPFFSTEVPPDVEGENPGSLAFSGSGEFLEFLDSPGAIQPVAYSLSAWVRVDAVQQSAIMTRTSANGPTVNWSHQFRITADGRFEAYIFDGEQKIVTGTTVIEPGVWYHVLSTASNGGELKLYVNGIQEGPSVPIATMWAGGNRWHLGSGSGGGYFPFVGLIDEVGMWFSTPLDASSIARLSAGESPADVVNEGAVSTGLQLVDPVVIAEGTLTDNTGMDVITPDVFPLETPVTARYVLFEGLGPIYAASNLGLNEIVIEAEVDTTPPAVDISKAVFLTWPHTPFPFVLESSPSLEGGVWTRVTNQPTLVDTTLGVFVHAEEGAEYYRLRILEE